LESRAGAMLDSVLDRYADAALIFGIWAGGLCDFQSAFLAALGSLLVSYTRARAEGLGIDLAGVGLAERAERLATLVLASWIALAWEGALELGLLILVFMTHMTAAQRAAHAFLALRSGA
ncbi:CDP-alcohol phosphatidyltransferase family protein, partial [Candidatus Bathyarchaeota archaeon]